MFCKHCGNQIPDDTTFCPYCGAQLTNSAAAPQSNGKKNLAIPLIAGLSVILLVLLIILAIMFTSIVKGEKGSSPQNAEEIAAEAADTSPTLQSSEAAQTSDDFAAPDASEASDSPVIPETSQAFQETDMTEGDAAALSPEASTVQISDSQPSSPIRGAYEAVMNYPQFSSSDLFDDHFLNWRIVGSANSYDSNPSQFIDRGDYYEVTNCNITIPNVISADVISQLTPNCSLTVQSQSSPTSSYTDTFTVGELHSCGESSYYALNDPDSSEWCGELWLSPDGSGYVLLIDEVLITSLIYSGSLYFSKDCSVYSFYDYQHSEPSKPMVPFSDYITQPQSFGGGYEYGNQNGRISICGYPVFDPDTGLIVKFKEQFML